MVEYGKTVLPAFDFQGRAVAVVIAKAAWRVGEDRVVRPEPAPEVLLADVPMDPDDPLRSPVLLEADGALIKRLTDVIVHATAYAPDGRPAPAFDVAVSVGGRRRTLRVTGPRKAAWQPGSRKEPAPPTFRDPLPVRQVAVDFRNAYGGMARYRAPDADDVLEVPCPANPLGKGYCVQNSPEGIDGLDLPQVEDPEHRLDPMSLVHAPGEVEDLPIVAGFGVYGAAWYPRAAWFGVMPHEAGRVRAAVAAQVKTFDPVQHAAAIEMLRDYEPPVMAPEHHQAAAPGMTFPALSGDEVVVLTNLSPGGNLGFDLPGRAPIARLDAGDGPRAVAMMLDTVVFLAEDGRLLLTWRGRVPLPGPEAFDRLPGMPLDVTDATLAEARRAVPATGPAD